MSLRRVADKFADPRTDNELLLNTLQVGSRLATDQLINDHGRRRAVVRGEKGGAATLVVETQIVGVIFFLAEKEPQFAQHPLKNGKVHWFGIRHYPIKVEDNRA